MSTGNVPREDADLDAFLGRQSPISVDYDNLEPVEPPTSLDDKVLAAATVAAKSAPKPLAAPVVGKPAPTQPARATAAAPPDPVEPRNRSRPPPPVTSDDDDEAAAPSSRPPWLLPAALAASVLVALGVAFAVFMNGPSDTTDPSLDSSLFAKRARERSEEDKKATAAASAQQDTEVVELELAPLPPPPVFEAEGPQVQDLDAAIVLVRKELLLANRVAASQAEPGPESPGPASATAPAGTLADAGAPVAAAISAAPSVVQPRERRLTKILELYDGGNPDLAGDSLEIFLRDFEDDPVSQRILGVKP